MQGSKLRQCDTAVATHGHGHRAILGDAANDLFDIGETFVGIAWRHVDIPTVDYIQAREGIEIRMGRLIRPK
jgi:hypothetical protein